MLKLELEHEPELTGSLIYYPKPILFSLKYIQNLSQNSYQFQTHLIPVHAVRKKNSNSLQEYYIPSLFPSPDKDQDFVGHVYYWF